MTSQIATFAASLLLLAAPALTATAEESPEKIVREATQQASAFMNDGNLSNNEARKMIRFLDVDRIARFALGRHVRSMSTDQYAEYKGAFSRYLREQLQDHLEDFSGSDVRIEKTVARSASDVIVETSVVDPSGENVNWRIRQRDGKWGIVDVEAMDLWLAIEQRAQFTAKLDANGGDVDALINDIDPRVGN